MSFRGAGPILAAVAVMVLVVGGFYVTFSSTSTSLQALSSQNANLAAQNSNLNQQLADLNGANANLNQQLSSLYQGNSNLNQQVNGLNQQLNGLGQEVSSLETKTVQIVTVTNMVVEVQTTTSVSTTTLTSVSQVPLAALVVISDSYSNATKTFTFQVQNTQNYTIYAQLSASLWGQSSFGCNGQIGNFISQVYTFNPNSNTMTTLNLALGQYVGFCGTNPVTSAQVNYVIPQSTAISLTYSFNIVPGYTHP